jgi:hypothetical protein
VDRERIQARIAMVEALEAASERRHEILDLVVTAPNRPAAAQAIASALGIDPALADAVLDRRLTYYTADQRALQRQELADLHERLEGEA